MLTQWAHREDLPSASDLSAKVKESLEASAALAGKIEFLHSSLMGIRNRAIRVSSVSLAR